VSQNVDIAYLAVRYSPWARYVVLPLYAQASNLAVLLGADPDEAVVPYVKAVERHVRIVPAKGRLLA